MFRSNINTSKGFLIGRKNMKESTIGLIIQNISKLAITILFFYLFGFETEILAYAFVLSFAIASIFLILKVMNEIKRINKNFENVKYEKATKKEYWQFTKEIIPFGMVVTLISYFWVLITYSDRILLGYLLPQEIASAEVGVYSIALGMGTILIAFTISIRTIFFPVISELLGKKETEKMKKTAMTSTKWILMAIIPITLLFCIFSEELLGIIYGKEYQTGWLALVLLTLGLFLKSAGTVPSMIIVTYKKLDIEFKIAGSAAIMNIILNILLIPQYGINGAAFSSLIAFAISSILFFHYSGKILELKFPIEVYKSIIAGIIAFGIILLLKSQILLSIMQITTIQIGAEEGGIIEESIIKIATLVILGILFLVCSIIYLAVLILLKAFGKEELSVLEAGLRKVGIPEKYRNLAKDILEAKYLDRVYLKKQK
ncbi:MAG: polysaccharide biosynthesis C-terminal domain-containing protein [Candidatus ainarchaeum sp.]|nr:polysaccharide biosynthesis C-terminal domain-containing protein [Candidatus ainarchaeum sp.]